MHFIILIIHRISSSLNRLFSRENRLMHSLVLLFIITMIGVQGYVWIENYSYLNALYETVITLSTVGYGELSPLSDAGKLFTIFLIIAGLGIFAYTISAISSNIMEGKMQFYFKTFRKRYELRNMENHVIVTGYGRNGLQVVKELLAHQHQVVVIDEKETTTFDDVQVPFVTGDATEDHVLQKANIESAKAIILCLPNDADNLYCALASRALNPSITIVSRASNESSEKKLRIAGVKNIVMPEKVGGAHMAKLITSRDLVDFIDHMSIHGSSETSLEELELTEFASVFLDKTIEEAGIRYKTGVNIIGMKMPDGNYILNPDSESKLLPGVKLFVMGTPAQISSLKQLLSS
ncbi:MAG: NAD-binding protein [Bacteroidales bacterium]|nr:NAD-binding protein [Bacteroidales bacterium]